MDDTLLDSVTNQHTNIFLIGLMGSGKTTVGKRLATLMEYDFVDIDQEIVHRTGVSIAHIFEVEGETGFRQRETRMLTEVCDSRNTIVSTGGGVVSSLENQQLMKRSGVVVYLNVPLNVLWNRLKGCQHRPLLLVENPKEKLQQLMEERAPLYTDAADVTISITTGSALKTARKIQQLISNL